MYAMDSKARQIHQKAADAREKGEFLDALKIIDEAMIVYQEENDKPGFIESQADRTITLRLLSEKTGDKNFLILAKHAAMGSVEIALESGDKTDLALPFLNLARVQETLGEINDAVENYKKAVKNIIENPPTSNNRPGVVADFKIHLATCEYKQGDKLALNRALSAISDLEASDEDSYNKNVWLSGGLMSLAEVIKSEDINKAKEYLEKAGEIINSDQRLKIRLSQWEKLAQTIK